MTTIIEAIYEGGHFRPVSKVELKEGTHAEVRVPQLPRDPRAVAARLCQLAAKATRRGRQENTARDHDEVLDGRKGQS